MKPIFPAFSGSFGYLILKQEAPTSALASGGGSQEYYTTNNRELTKKALLDKVLFKKSKHRSLLTPLGHVG